MSVPNLDSLDSEDLMKLWVEWQQGHRNQAEEVFGGKFPGYTRALKSLANYALNKATAIKCRIEGDIERALIYEEICDKIYDALPDHIQW